MSYARQLLDSYPHTINLDASLLAATITPSPTARRLARPTPTTT
ncbi:MAG: hypothetical protein ACRDOK_06360 [Streptosporangiaceae bacterium]